MFNSTKHKILYLLAFLCSKLNNIYWPQGYKTFFILNLTEHEISLFIKTKMLKCKDFAFFKHSDVFILLITVKMQTTVLAF